MEINLPPFGAGLVGTHLVYLPSYLNVRVLPTDIKIKVAKQVDYFIARKSNNSEFMSNPYGLKRWEGLVHYMNQEDWSHKLPTTIDYLETCDSTRNIDFRKIFPELKGLE
jgi:hypothetical protein